MDPVMLAVIGAGPKAAAVAARVAALHVWQRSKGVVPALHLHIFERSARAGAHWYGEAGYTDGAQLICTPPERDLIDGAPADELDLSPYSWQSFIARHRVEQPVPTHRELAAYVAWSIELASERSAGAVALHLDAEVTRLRRDGDRWAIGTRSPAAQSRELASRFDGVVVTSPGPALSRFHVDSRIASRVGDASTYWSEHREAVRSSLQQGRRIAIVGAGGAAAAICADALRDLEPAADPGGIVIVAPQATLFTRGDSRFENDILTHDATWRELPRAARRDVAERLISGVVFRRVLDDLESLELGPAFMPARVVAAVPHDDSIALWCIALDERALLLEVDRVIDASGFDPLWFAGLFEEPVRTILRRMGPPLLADRLDRNLRLVVEAGMYDDETIREALVADRPGLHVPFLAGGSRPPGRASLLAMGQTAAEILAPYDRR